MDCYSFIWRVMSIDTGPDLRSYVDDMNSVVFLKHKIEAHWIFLLIIGNYIFLVGGSSYKTDTFKFKSSNVKVYFIYYVTKFVSDLHLISCFFMGDGGWGVYFSF